MSCYGVPLVPTVAAAAEEEAAAAAAQLGGRVVLKAEAEGLVHRTGAGGVRVDLRTPQEVAEGYRTLAADFGPRLQRVLVQPMLAGGVEVHIGVAQEPVFGPLVVFGSGDAATEVPGDHVTRLTPLTDADAEEMIRAVHVAPLLAGERGTPPVDTAALADALLRVSRLADDLPEVAELDLNPVLARPDGVLVRGRAGADQPGRAQGSLPATAAVSTRQRTDSQQRARSAIPGSQPRRRAGLVLAAALSGSGPVRPHAITGAICRQAVSPTSARIACPPRLCSPPRVSIPVTWSSTAKACRGTATRHEERGRPDRWPGRGRRRRLAVVSRLLAAGLALEAAAGLIGDHRATGIVQEAISKLDLVVGNLRDMMFDHYGPDLPAAGRRG